MFSNRHFPQRITIISSDEVPKREFRLDPTRFNERGERVTRHFRDRGIPTVRIGDWDSVTRVFVAPRFKRPYVESETEGVPFLGSSSMLALRLPRDYLLAKSFQKLPSLMLHGGEVLLSCSGTIGVSVLCGMSHRGYALSQHAARIYADPKVRGYLHAFLSSELGRELVLQQNYGKVIKELTEEQIRNVAVPILPPHLIAVINKMMLDAAASYDTARELLNIIEGQVQEALQYAEKADPNALWASKVHQCFLKSSEGLFNYRLDPHFYLPDVLALRNAIKRVPHFSLGDVADVWMPNRFARPSATRGHGVSFYTSADMMRARRTYTSTVARKASRYIKQCLIKPRMTLICRSGAFGGIMGRATFASSATDGWAVTEDMVRCVVTSEEYTPEYVYAILSCLALGYPLITAFRYGKDVPHIDSEELKAVPLPVLTPSVRSDLTKKVQDVYAAVDMANQLEEKAVACLLENLHWQQEEVSEIAIEVDDNQH